MTANLDTSDSSYSNLVKMQENTADQMSWAQSDDKKNYAEFIDMASHDLEAPLRKLSMLVERLVSKYQDISADDEQAGELIIRINGAIAQMRSLINDLSELAGVSSDPVKDDCNIGNLVKEVLDESEKEIKDKKVVITQSNLPVIKGSGIQLKRLFKNILENAMRFSKKNSSPEIDIRSFRLSEEEKKLHALDRVKEYYKIEISDNGIGFKQKYAQKIFQPFVRLNGRSAFAGNGFGLAICKRIIDNHGGMLYAEGIENTGSRFTLILPETLN